MAVAWSHRFIPSGGDDLSGRLLIPEKLYGREREVDALLAAFDRVVAGGRPELVLVSGYSGIGKSAVVNELHKSLVSPRGLFASGKFDQYKRDIPYATVAQAFHSLIRPLLSKPEAELSKWRDDLCTGVKPEWIAGCGSRSGIEIDHRRPASCYRLTTSRGENPRAPCFSPVHRCFRAP